MIHLQDPPRLCQCESTPRELRAWLVSAQRSRSSADIEDLVQVLECLVGLGANGFTRAWLVCRAHPTGVG